MDNYAFRLQFYLKYKTGTSNCNADCLIRFPKDCENDFWKLENLVFLTDLVESSVTSVDVKDESAKDPIISRVIHMFNLVGQRKKF